LNGVKQVVGVDFTATSGTNVVFTTGLVAGDIVDIVAYGAFNVANTYTQAQTDALLADKLSLTGGTMTGAITFAAAQLVPVANGGTGATTAPGALTALGAAALGANTFTGAQEWATGTAIASASTINLNTATGNRVHITGTTAITAVTLTRGPRTLIFDGILTLTHNATTNNLPGAADITTAAGDRAIYESDGTTVYCVSYIKASGEAVVASGGAPVGAIIYTALNYGGF